jgi:hypothetical protein
MASDQDAIVSKLADWQAAFLKDDLSHAFEFVKLASMTNSPDEKPAIESAMRIRDFLQRFMPLAIYLRDRDRQEIVAEISRLNALIEKLRRD